MDPAEGFDLDKWQTIITIGVVVIFFYLIMWRPEAKRRKELDTRRNALKPGDRVIAMGVIGVVVKTTDSSVILKMIDGNKLEFIKAAVSEFLPEEKEKA